jgi:hypothetical protein
MEISHCKKERDAIVPIMTTTKNIIPHVFLADHFSKTGAKGAKSFLKRQCRRALRRQESKELTEEQKTQLELDCGRDRFSGR